MVEQTGPAEAERLAGIAQDTWDKQHPGGVEGVDVHHANHVNKTDTSKPDVDSTNPDQTGSNCSDSAKEDKVTSPAAINVTESEGGHYKCDDLADDQTTVPLVINKDSNPKV